MQYRKLWLPLFHTKALFCLNLDTAFCLIFLLCPHLKVYLLLNDPQNGNVWINNMLSQLFTLQKMNRKLQYSFSDYIIQCWTYHSACESCLRSGEGFRSTCISCEGWLRSTTHNVAAGFLVPTCSNMNYMTFCSKFNWLYGSCRLIKSHNTIVNSSSQNFQFSFAIVQLQLQKILWHVLLITKSVNLRYHFSPKKCTVITLMTGTWQTPSFSRT